MAVRRVKVLLGLLQDSSELRSLVVGNATDTVGDLGDDGINERLAGVLELADLGVSGFTSLGLLDIATSREEAVRESLGVLLELLDGADQGDGLAGGDAAGLLDSGGASVDGADELVGLVNERLLVAIEGQSDLLEVINAGLGVSDDALDGGEIAGSDERRGCGSEKDDGELHVEGEGWK